MSDWPHAPLHRFPGRGVFFVTASTYLKQHFYRRSSELELLHSSLLSLSLKHAVALQAWSVFSNHYHLVCTAAGDDLQSMLHELHSTEAIRINERDAAPGRKVWFQFRETELTFEKSWMARLNYAVQNPVKHGLVQRASEYRWCSARWMESTARPSFLRTLARFDWRRVKRQDEHEVVLDL